MVGSSKILTVSYGTFSCTLEGFDDSFGTMKAIAEYFRDLAADDRYFGAEPPVPDAEMLSRIAEREVARRVEARLDGKGITLRTGDALPQTPAATGLADILHSATEAEPAVAVQPASPPVMPPRVRPVMRQVITRAEPDPATDSAPAVAALTPVIAPPRVVPMAMPVSAPAAAAPVMPPRAAPAATHEKFTIPAHPDADSVAAKLQRIRAVVGRGSPAFTAQEFAEDLGETPAQSIVGADSDADAEFTPTPDHSLSASWNDLTDATDDASLAVAATELPDTTAEDDGFDLSSLSATPATEAPLADILLADIHVAEPAMDAPPPVVRARVIRVRRADAEAGMAAAANTMGEAAPPKAADESLAELLDLPDLPDLDGLDGLNDLIALDGAQREALDSAEPDDSPALETEDLDFDAISATLDPLADLDIDLGDGTLPPDAEADLLQELAAVERDAGLAELAETDVLPHEQRNEQPGEQPDEMADEQPGEQPASPAPFSLTAVMAAAAQDSAAEALKTDEIAALLNAPPGDDEVFDFSAFSDAGPVATDDAATPDAASATVLRLGRDLLEREPEADAEAMERILSQTDAELNSPESSRRREAIAQLKAAVAATEAARKLGEKAETPEPDEVENAFRDDLKQVVRPRRPVGEVSPDQRSERPRPAPLKLVASQRIDIPAPRPAPKPILPVRPRRVAVQDDGGAPATSPAMATSFAEFAASMGATQLPDLLEAAAAYTSFVEGVEDFSRPQLMKKVQDMAEQDFSREDGLRSFGTLLRQGRIMKTANGRFVVNEETRFNPERRTA